MPEGVLLCSKPRQGGNGSVSWEGCLSNLELLPPLPFQLFLLLFYLV
jgi:hypothetical protein